MEPEFRIDIEDQTNAHIVRMFGDLDLASTPAAKKQLLTALEEGARNVLVDTAGLGHVDTTGLGLFVWLRKRVGERQGVLCLFGNTPQFQRLLDLTGLAAIFSLCGDQQDALDAVAR